MKPLPPGKLKFLIELFGSKFKQCKCGYWWVSRIENPKKCPSCFSRDWNKNIKVEKAV
jgi:rubrerythrin